MAVTIKFDNGDVVNVDAAMSQNHERNAEVTKHPVEKGADIADHIRPLPDGLNIHGIISTVSVVDMGQEPTPNRHKKAQGILDSASANRRLATVHTGIKIYTNMAVKHIAYHKDPSNGTNLVFTIEFEEIKFATSQTVQVPKSALGPKAATSVARKSITRRASPKNVRGNAAAKPADATKAKSAAKVATDTKPKSILNGLMGQLPSLLKALHL
jgi:hypothetical protein